MPPSSLLVARARRGDAGAWRQLYDQHAPSVYGYCVTFCRQDRASADDLCQETFTAAFAALPELQDDGAFGGWVRVIARRRCLRWLESRQREAGALAQLKTEPVVAHAPLAARPDLDHLARLVLDACPDPTLKQTAGLFYGDPPASTGEIAERTGVTVTAVTTRLHRFRAWARVYAARRLDTLWEEAG